VGMVRSTICGLTPEFSGAGRNVWEKRKRWTGVRWNELLGGGAPTLHAPLNEATPPTP
jgi:hypothetical protein